VKKNLKYILLAVVVLGVLITFTALVKQAGIVPIGAGLGLIILGIAALFTL
jgi:hypothetical protein